MNRCPDCDGVGSIYSSISPAGDSTQVTTASVVRLYPVPAPSLDLIHLKTSKLHEKDSLVNRYWFEWTNRRQLGAIVVRLELLDAAGKALTKVSVRLPKVKITGYLPATDTGHRKPTYDSTIYIKLDAIDRDVIPVAFRYYTLTKKFTHSPFITVPMTGLV